MSVSDFTGSVGRKQRGKQVRRIQEWLCLNDIGVVVDGDFGPATEFAVREFQEEGELGQTGVVDSSTFEALVGLRHLAFRISRNTLRRIGLEKILVAFVAWRDLRI